jgi:hypothetical protein
MQLSLLFERGEPLAIDAEPVRRNPDDGFGATLAVAFDDLSAQQEDVIQDALLNALEALNGPSSGVRGPAANARESAAPRRVQRKR